MAPPVGTGSIIILPNFSKFESTVRSFAGRAAGAMGALTTAVTGAGLAGLITFGLKSAASLEQAQVGFETLLGSGRKAQAFLTNLQKFAAATPFELPGLIESSRTLLGVGVDAKKVIPFLTAFGDTAGAVGIGQEAFQRIVLATSQAISAGKFQVGDLNQIMTNGIPIYKLLSEALGKPVPVIRQLASEGKLLAKDVLPVLQKQMEKDYGGAMARQSQTLAGVWSTLKDSVAIGLANAIKPLVPLLTDLVPKAAAAASRGLAGLTTGVVALIAGYRGQAGATGGFAGDMQRVGTFARAAAPVVEHLAVTIGTILRAALQVAGPLIGGTIHLLSQYRGVAVTLAGAIVALTAITRVHAAVLAVEAAGGLVKYIAQIRVVTSLTKVWAAVQWLMNAALDANPIGIVVIALAALVGGLIYAWKNSETFRRVVTGAWAGVRAIVSSVVGWFTNSAGPAVVKVFKDVGAAALVLWHAGFEPAWHGMQRVVQAASAVIQLAIAIVVAYIRGVVAPAFAWLWHTIVEPVMHGIQGTTKSSTDAVRGLLAITVGVLRGTFGPAFTTAERVITAAWNGVKSSTSSMRAAVQFVLTALGNFAKGTLVNDFRNAVAAIAVAWNGLKAAAKAPVTFVVNSVINPLISGFNRLARTFHTPTIDPIGGFAEGGKIPGAASARDNRLAWLKDKAGRAVGTLAVATGEFIVNAKDTAKALPLLQWINQGMKGGPGEAARRVGRPVAREPGDGSEGWAFANGGLVGFIKDVWGAISNPAKAIKAPVEAALARIPGGGLIKDFLIGMGHRLVDGFIGWVSGVGTDGASPGTVGKAQRFLAAQNGKPYVWASAGPGGYDCCVRPTTLVYGPDKPKEIQHLQPGDRVYAFQDGKVITSTVNAAWMSKVQPVFRLQTRNRDVYASANHPFLRLAPTQQAATSPGARGDSGAPWGTEWVRLDQLKRGDYIVTFQGTDDLNQTGESFPEDMAWFLGLFMGDGCFNNDAIRLCVYGEVRDRATAIVAKHWGRDAKHHPAAGMIVNKASAVRWMREQGFEGRSHEKRLPPIVWTWDAAAQEAFLAGYGAADGWVPKPGSTTRADMVYKSTSEGLMRDLRALHTKLGHGVTNIRKQERARPIIIAGVEVKHARPLYGFSVTRSRRATVGATSGRLRPEAHQEITSWDRALGVQPILDITPAGVEETWDINVEGSHNFIADGVVVHNSGIVSAVYNILKGKSPYSHTFSTESAGQFFTKPGIDGPLVAAWSHPGQRPASASVGHMMGRVGGLTFESTGSRGVHLGSTTRSLSDFANIGHFAQGGLARLAKVARADFGAVTLERGHNLIYNGTGKPEPLQSPPSTGIGRLHPDDIDALARAIGSVVGAQFVSTVPSARVAARQIGTRPGR